MACKPVKQLLMLIALSLTWHSAQGMQKLTQIPFNYYFLMATHVYLADRETITIARQNMPHIKRAWLTNEDAHEDVQAFIKAQLKTTKDKQLLDGLQIKKTNHCGSMAVTNGGIEILNEKHDELLEALRRKKTNTLRQQDLDVLAYSEVVCKHEFGHLKHKDLSRTRFFHPTVSLALHGITWGLTKLCSLDKYYLPSSYEDTRSTLDMFKGGAFLIATGIAQGFIHQKLTQAYSKYYKEKRAQKYALDNTHDPETLRGYARQELNNRKKRSEELAAEVIEEINKSVSKRVYLKFYSHYIYHIFLKQHPEYKKSRYTQATLNAFRKWLLQQDVIINKLERLFNSTHATYTELIQEAQRAADTLESYQKKRAAAQF